MNRVIPVLLALVAVSSLLAIPVASQPGVDARDDPDPALQLSALQSSGGPVMEAEGTTNRLQLSGDIRTERVEYGTDIGLSLASFDDRLRVDREQYTIVDSEFESASNDERKEMVSTASSQIKERIGELKVREEKAVEDHSNGTLSDTELIRVLLRNQNEAEMLYDAIGKLQERTDEIPGYGLPAQQTRADKTLLEHHQTTIRSSLERAGQSTADQQVELLIQTSEDGYSLSMIEGDTYLRETVRFTHYPNGHNQFEDDSDTYTAVMDHAADLYPWAGDVKSWSSFSDSGKENIYTMWMEADHDELEIHLDAASGKVYREMQELSLESLPVADTETATEDGLELTLRRTPANGPAAVTVTEAESNESVTATVSVDGTEIGTTDDDGTLWFVPPGAEYDLTVETDDGRIAASVAND